MLRAYSIKKKVETIGSFVCVRYMLKNLKVFQPEVNSSSMFYTSSIFYSRFNLQYLYFSWHIIETEGSTLERFPQKMLKNTLSYVHVNRFKSQNWISQKYLSFSISLKLSAYKPSFKCSSAAMMVMCWWKWSSSWYSAWWWWRGFYYVELMMVMNSWLSYTCIYGGLLWK